MILVFFMWRIDYDQKIDFDKALKVLQTGQPISDKGDVLTPLIKQLTEAALSS